MGISEDAVKFIKQNKKLLIERFANEKIFKPAEKPMSFFMAGSAGAGKTEYSKAVIKYLGYPIVRIDADEIKDIIPQYNRSNAKLIQGASALGVEKLFDYVLKKRLHFILDSTFANFKIAHSNIKRTISKRNVAGIFYLYQEPLIAWEFTKKREKLKGRPVPKKVFVDSVFKSKENVLKIKSIFKDKIIVFFIKKNFLNEVEQSWSDIDNVDKYLKIPYTPKSLYKALKKYEIKKR